MKKIDELLSSIPKDTPTADFTSSVMGTVFSLAEEESVKEISLEKLLSSQAPQKVSMNFSAEIMKNISEPKQAKPLVSKWGWAAIVTVALSLLFLPYFYSSKESPEPFSININFEQIPMVFPLSVFALGVLIFADYFFRNRKTFKI
jgi:hypothetical protein